MPAAYQFAPWIDVKPNGTIDVAWYDGQLLDGMPTLWNAVMSRSTDGGNTWSAPLAVGDAYLSAPLPVGSATRWLGEYLALVVDRTWAHMAFCSARNDPGGFGNVFYDRVPNRGMPQPLLPGASVAPVGIKPIGR